MERAHTEAVRLAARRVARWSLLALVALGLGACASTQHADRYEALEPGAEAPRESAATVFALIDTSTDAESAWLASRNDASLSPGPAHRSLPTTSWPNTGTTPEQRRLPVIYSRWGRSF